MRRWPSSPSGCAPVAELLFWPALLAYGEAVVAYFGETRSPGLPGRLATWGVRIGWLLQTALLVLQAARANGFPWASWAGSLNLFVWLVVSAYLVWGCRDRYRLLGLAVTPLAVAFPALTLGIAVGLVRLRENGGSVDALMAVTVATWLAYGSYVVLRATRGWRGRRAAYFALAAFALVIIVRLALPATHFA